MCINDWRLGTLIKFEITTFTLTISSRVFARNQNRVGIEIRQNTQTATGPIVLAVNGIAFGTLLQGLGGSTALWTLENSGQLCQQEWTLSNTAGVVTATVIEYFAPTGIIAAGIDEFKRAYPGSNI
jgi:hypothetical protein